MALKCLVFSLTLTVAGACYAQGDTLLLDGLEMNAQSAQMRPARGANMASVEARFGAPTERRAAVGDPPISRWEYPGFIVFFEHNIVLHTVVRR